jgi:hypothetical protein
MTRPVTTSNQKTILWPLKQALNPFTMIPMLMWITPIMTEVLILMLLTKVRYWGERNQAGSVPNPYTQSLPVYSEL